MASLKYLVSTAMGDSLLDPSIGTYVLITPDKFLVKSVGDIKPGDLILYAKPFAKTNLEDVEPYLTKSPRYEKAEEMLHDTNIHGERVPKLRKLLIEGLASKGIVSGEDLESRILFENHNDFSKKEYDAMEDYIYSLLTMSGTPKMSRQGVRNWIEGRVIAPRNWSLLEVLAKNLNPGLSCYQYGSQSPDSLYFNYRLYVTIRQGVMRFLNQARGTPSDEGWKEGENLITITPEYQIVFNHFLKDLSINYAAARVMSVTRVNMRRQIESLKERNPHIEAGIVRTSADLNFPRKSYSELMEDMGLLGSYINAAAEGFEFGQMRFADDTGFSPGRLIRVNFTFLLGSSLMEAFGEGLDSEMQWYKKHSDSNKSLAIAYDSFKKRFKDAILMGEIDSSLFLDRGTIMRLLEAYFRTRTAVPNSVHDYVSYMLQLKVTKKGKPLLRNERREVGRRQVKLHEKYGLEFDQHSEIKIGQFHSDIFKAESMALSLSPREFLSHLRSNQEKFAEAVDSIAKSERKIFTRKQTSSILRDFSLEDIVDLRKEDFYWEEI